MIANFRDVGGYEAAGGSVRTGVLYRSATLAGLSDAAVVYLGTLGIRTVIDLRRPDEVAKYGRVPDADDRRYHNIAPVHELWEAGPDYDEAAGPARYLADRYATLAHDGAAEYGQILRLLGGGDAAPVVVHCFAGKDRTGVLIAITLALLGVADDDIAADYALTDDWTRTGPLPTHIPAHWIPAPAEAIHLFLTELRADYGSLDSYAASAGLEDTDVAALRAALIRPRRRT